MVTDVEWITGKELAGWLKLSRDSIDRGVQSGDLPRPVRVGRRYRWDRSEVLQHLNRSRNDADNEQSDSSAEGQMGPLETAL